MRHKLDIIPTKNTITFNIATRYNNIPREHIHAELKFIGLVRFANFDSIYMFGAIYKAFDSLILGDYVKLI